MSPRTTRIRDGITGYVLYDDEVCPHGTCQRPLDHDGLCDQFDGPPAADQLQCHPPDPDPATIERSPPMDMKAPFDINHFADLLDQRAAGHVNSLQGLADELKAQIGEYARNAQFVAEKMNGYLPTATVFHVSEMELPSISPEYRQITEPELRFRYGHNAHQIRLGAYDKGIENVRPGRYRAVVMLLPIDLPNNNEGDAR